jgi:hypothetical protein
MENLKTRIDIDSSQKPLNAAILVAMGTSFMLGVVFCLFIWEAWHERLMTILTGLGLVVLFSYGVFHRTKRIFAAIRELITRSVPTNH